MRKFSVIGWHVYNVLDAERPPIIVEAEDFEIDKGGRLIFFVYNDDIGDRDREHVAAFESWSQVVLAQ